jgi:hypothetical protein
MSSYQMCTLCVVLPKESAKRPAERTIEQGTSSSSMLPNPMMKRKSRESIDPMKHKSQRSVAILFTRQASRCQDSYYGYHYRHAHTVLPRTSAKRLAVRAIEIQQWVRTRSVTLFVVLPETLAEEYMLRATENLLELSSHLSI